MVEELPTERLTGGMSRRRLSGERLELIYYRYPGGSDFARHVHDSEQLTVVLQGELVFTFDDDDVKLSAGEGILIPGGLRHGAFVPSGVTETVTYNVFTPVRSRPPDAATAAPEAQ